ncbi:hypothetical protein D9613_009150 [Agrocybe pediades]|uniref:Uncharacterized protein n=1 Tax=Agrocybe pediades TaxID=84607 RepID=A0A8H4R5D7_9AGAR|nr:hypothetical protein D9613_009150 [Agrocybe pediades]
MLFSWTALCQVKRLVPTMMVFVEHGGCYFSLAIMAKIANAIVVTTYSGPLQGAAIAWLMALYPVLVTRIYLSMVQYLNYGVPMKSERPRMFGSHDREYYGSGFIDEAEDGDDDDDDGEEGYARDIEFARGLRGDDWDGASEATFSFSADSPRASRSRRTSRVRRVSRPQRPGNRDDERRRRSRGPRLGRITFAARESLGSPSVIDFMDEEF